MGKKKKKKKKKVPEPNLAGPTSLWQNYLLLTAFLFHDYNGNCHHQTPKLLLSFRPLSFLLSTLHQQQSNRLFFFFLFDFFIKNNN
jgi:hypothetical protein